MKPTPKEHAQMIQDANGREYTYDLIEALQEINKCPEGICDGSGLIEASQWDEDSHQYQNTGDTRPCECCQGT